MILEKYVTIYIHKGDGIHDNQHVENYCMFINVN